MELYQFQQEDVDKLKIQKSAAIGSEMACGKTHEAIALDEIWCDEATYSNPKTLVIAPLNTFNSWQEKYAEQSPGTRVTVIDRKNRDLFVNALNHDNGDVFLMHWDALRRMPDLRQFKFETIIADEAHRASSRASLTTNALKKLKTNHKLAMSGTLSGDKPDGLWSIFNWLWPQYYRSYWAFRKAYIDEWTNPHTGYREILGVKNEKYLHEQIAPWYVRHLKRNQCCDNHPNGVLSWLPEVTHDRITVDISPTQRRIYNEMRSGMVAWIGEQQQTPLVASIVIAKLARLSQIALATPKLETELHRRRDKELNPPLVYNGGWRQNPDGTDYYEEVDVVNLELPSSKLDALKEWLNDHPDKPVIVVSSSAKMCELVKEDLNKFGYPTELLYGKTPQAIRDVIVSNFNAGKFRVFLGVIEAMAEGVDGLQYGTDTIIFLDRSWWGMMNKQTEERVDRPGQKNATNIIDIVARDTVDIQRHHDLDLKWDSVRKILGDI